MQITAEPGKSCRAAITWVERVLLLLMLLLLLPGPCGSLLDSGQSYCPATGIQWAEICTAAAAVAPRSVWIPVPLPSTGMIQ
jgi:hypothetical protein